MDNPIYAAQDSIDRTMTGLKDGVAAATSGAEQAQATMRDGMAKAVKMAEDMFAFAQGNLEAITRSGQIFAAGMQDMGQSLATASKSSMNETVGTFKAMAGAKSVKEAMDLQSSLLRSSLENAVTQASQLTDSTMRLSEQTLAPISARLSLAAEKFGRI